MPDDLESEYKLRANAPIEVAAVDAALRELGVTCGARHDRRQLDTYLDDHNASLRRAGIGLRLRQIGDRRRLTCKGPRQSEGALFVRRENEADWHAPDLPRGARELPEPVRGAVAPTVGAAALEPHLVLETHREVRMLRADAEDEDACELAIDLVEARANGRSARFAEVELEVLGDDAWCEQLAHALRDRLPLEFATRDKPSHAAALLGLELPAEHGAAARGAEAIGATVQRLLRDRLARLRELDATLQTERPQARDVETVHKMRVAARTMRTVARSFAELWTPTAAERLRTALRDVGAALGEVRDLDVLLAQLPARIAELPEPLRDPAAATVRWLDARRDEAAARLSRDARTPAHAQRFVDIERAIGELADGDGPLTPSDLAAAPRLREQADDVRRRVRRIDRSLPLPRAHRLRIAAKRLRYLAELFAPQLERPLRRLRRVQKRLGQLCDDELTAARMCAWIEPAARSGLEPAAVAALGALATQARQRADAARGRARRALSKLDRKKVWRELRDATT